MCWYVSHVVEWALSMKIMSLKWGWQAYTPLVCHACRHAHFPYGFSSKRETARSLTRLLQFVANVKYEEKPYHDRNFTSKWTI